MIRMNKPTKVAGALVTLAKDIGLALLIGASLYAMALTGLILY